MSNFEELKVKYEIDLSEEEYNNITSHFSKMMEFYEKNNSEWQEEAIDEDEVFGVTFDFEEWLNITENDIEGYYKCWDFDTPINIAYSLIQYTNRIKDYLDGFIVTPVALYKGKTLVAKHFTFENFDSLVEHLKQQKENNKNIFLRIVYERPVDSTSKDINYFIRYAAMEG